SQSRPKCLGTGGLGSWVGRHYISYPRDLLRLLRLGGVVKRKEQSDKNNTGNFSIHCFPSRLTPYAYRLTAASFDHSIRPEQHGLRNRQIERFRGLEIDQKLEFRRPFDRQVCGLGAFEDPVNVGGGTSIEFGDVGTIGYEAALLCPPRAVPNRWQTTLRRKFENALSIKSKETRCWENECVRAFLSREFKRALKIIRAAYLNR